MPGLFIAGVMIFLGSANRFHRKAHKVAFIDFDHNFAVSEVGYNQPLHKDATSQ